MSDETVPRLVTLWCPEWPTIAARTPPHMPAAVFHANRVIACTPAARAAGVGHGDRRRVAQAACPAAAGARARRRPRRPRVRADRARHRRHRAACRGRRTRMAVRRRARPGALLRRRSSAGDEASCRSPAESAMRPDRGRHRRRQVGRGDRLPPRHPPGRPSARRPRRILRPSSSSRWRSDGCASSARSTPSWSTCSCDWGSARSGGWRRSTRGTCCRGSARSACTLTGWRAAPTSARRRPPIPISAGGSSSPSTSRSSNWRRSCSS